MPKTLHINKEALKQQQIVYDQQQIQEKKLPKKR
jgi:hypothetical protein